MGGERVLRLLHGVDSGQPALQNWTYRLKPLFNRNRVLSHFQFAQS